MNTEQLKKRYEGLKLEASEVLQGCDDQEWKDEYLRPKDYSPEFDYGQEDSLIHFNIILGKMLMVIELMLNTDKPKFTYEAPKGVQYFDINHFRPGDVIATESEIKILMQKGGNGNIPIGAQFIITKDNKVQNFVTLDIFEKDQMRGTYGKLFSMMSE